MPQLKENPVMTSTLTAQPRASQSLSRSIALAIIGLASLVTSGIGIYASLQATASNVTPQAIDSGTLKLKLTDNGAGFSQAITNVAPGDIVNRYVTLESTGTLDGKDLTLTTVSSGTSTLITDGSAPSTTKAFRLAVTSCSVAWTSSNGTCGGSTTELLAPITLSSAATFQTLVSGAMNSGDTLHLRIQLQLPDQNETTVNGVLPTNSVQGGSISNTYTFAIAQRNGETTNS